MRIVQIIDSLNPGGAERMAVNYANALVKNIEFSGLIATRKEGVLLNQMDEKVSYLFVKKKKKIDFKAIFKVKRYVKENKIDIIHAHSSSFFFAVLVKLTYLKVKVIWHDHYGISQDLTLRKNIGLKFGSLFFIGSIAVNSALKNWAESYLWCSNIIYFPNFIDNSICSGDKVILKGVEGKRIICVANLRPQKNHQLLINSAALIKDKYPEWTFHLFGKDFQDEYSKKIKQLIRDLKLEQVVFFYGTSNNVASAIMQSEIAVLPSLSEGLPLVILEYGEYKKAVVATNVGQISKIITSNKEGLIVDSDDLNEFSNSIQKLIKNEDYRIKIGIELYKIVQAKFSEKIIVSNYVSWLNSLSNFVSEKKL